MNRKSRIPSESVFAYAQQKMNVRSIKERHCNTAILTTLAKDIPCHDICVWLSDTAITISYIFPSDKDMEKHKSNQGKNAIEVAVQRATHRMEIEKVLIEYHSHECILKNYNGNYEKYFR